MKQAASQNLSAFTIIEMLVIIAILMVQGDNVLALLIQRQGAGRRADYFTTKSTGFVGSSRLAMRLSSEASANPLRWARWSR